MAKTIYTKERNILSARLIQAREEAGYTQLQVMASIGISQSDLSKLENGQKKVDVLILDKLALFYNKPLQYFTAKDISVATEENNHYSSKLELSTSLSHQIIARRGPEKVRSKLIKKYKGKCMVTGSDFQDLLEAALIDPYKKGDKLVVQNWLLLRSDIHTLYDFNLIGIHPDSLQITLHKNLKKSEYSLYEGKQLVGCSIRKKPDKNSLKNRWEKFLEKASKK